MKKHEIRIQVKTNIFDEEIYTVRVKGYFDYDTYLYFFPIFGWTQYILDKYTFNKIIIKDCNDLKVVKDKIKDFENKIRKQQSKIIKKTRYEDYEYIKNI